MDRLQRVLFGLTLAAATSAGAAVESGISRDAAGARLGGIAVPFVTNAGQYDARVKFAAPTFAGTLLVAGDGALIYALPGQAPAARADKTGRESTMAVKQGAAGAVFSESFVGGRAQPQGRDPAAVNVSLLLGEQAQHRPRVATYERVSLGEVFPGVAVDLRSTGRNVEKIFTVAPGRDSGAIRMQVDGAQQLATTAEGALIVGTAAGAVTFTPPVAYQDVAGERRAVPVAYALDTARQRYGFTLGDYDRTQPLVIDPLLQTTYLGGTSGDLIKAMAIHPTTNEVYVLGQTASLNFPCTTTATLNCANGAQTNYFGSTDCFVAKLNPGLTSLIQATYFGGTGTEFCNTLVFAPDGLSVYISGQTQSTTAPVGGGAQQVHGAGSYNAFVSRLTADLQSLLAFSYYGAAGGEAGGWMAIHPPSGDVWLAGITSSSSGLLGINGSSAQPAISGTTDGFVARFNANLSQVSQATYLGGSSNSDQPNGLAWHPVNGDLYVVGITASTDFPQLAGGAVSSLGAGTRGYVARLHPGLTSVRQATLIGATNGITFATGLAIHPMTGDVYAAGTTTGDGLAAASSGAQPAHGADGVLNDVFVSRLDGSLTTLYRSTYFGGDDSDLTTAVAIHPVTGEIYVAGSTQSSTLPGTAGGLQSARGGAVGGSDGFVARFNPGLSRLPQATYFGGTGEEVFNAITIHPVTGDVYAAGSTTSAVLTGTTGGAQSSFAGPAGFPDALIVKMTADLTFGDTTPAPFAFTPKTGVPVATVQVSNPVLITGITDPATVYTSGSLTSAYCISLANDCLCGVADFTSTPGSVINNRYVCVRHTSAAVTNQLTSTTLYVGGQAATFHVSTGQPLGSGCTLDVDGNGAVDALTDGLMILRAMFGLTGTSVTNSAVGLNATRGTWALLQPYLNGNCGTSFSQ